MAQALPSQSHLRSNRAELGEAMYAMLGTCTARPQTSLIYGKSAAP